MLLALLLACDNPISNAVFLADEDFLAALPGPSRLGFPANLRSLDTTDEPILAFAGEAARDLEPVIETMALVGEVFRSAPPAERTPTSRRYDPRAITLPGTSQTWWMRADLGRATEEAPITWALEAAPTEQGPWTSFATGRHASDGVGEFEWDNPVIASHAGTDDAPPPVEVRYEDVNTDGLREVELTFEATFVLPVTYTFVGPFAFGFTGAFDYAGTGEPEDALPTWAMVVALESGAGRSEGALFTEGREETFVTCWDASGQRVFAGGSPLVGAPMGDESACPSLE
jgi:hypothetical protein